MQVLTHATFFVNTICGYVGRRAHFFITSDIMKNKRMDNERPRRRFREAVDGPAIRRWYARMRTSDLARMLGLTVKQIENFAHRNNMESWARKLASVLSAINSRNGKKGGRPKKIRK